MFVVNLLSYQKESAKVRKNTIKSSVFDRYFGIYFLLFCQCCTEVSSKKIKTAICFSQTPFRYDKTPFYFAENGVLFSSYFDTDFLTVSAS